MFCYNCGKEIDEKAVVCVHCGVETKNMNQKEDKNIIINNSSSSSSSASSSSAAGIRGVRRHYSLLLDIIMICFTGGLWIFWMIFRPKYY